MKLKDKIALITSGSRGIGYAIAEKYIQEGAKVAVAGSKAETAKKACNLLKEKYPDADIIPVFADARNTDEINAMFDTVVNKWGYIDILVNNSGISTTKEIDLMSDEDFEDVMNVNVTGMFRCARAAVKIMKAQGGCIINTSSLVSVNGTARQCAYTASKFAVNGLTKSLSRELGPYNIRVNAVAPGVVATDMVKESVTEAMAAYMNKLTPLGRMANPSEIASAYVYLASDDASYTTGAILNVHGGIVL